MDYNIIVTGGSGSIGNKLARSFSSDYANVKVIDTNELPSAIKCEPNIKFSKGSILDYNFLLKEFKNVDFVFHQAGLLSAKESIEDPKKYVNVNITGTLNVLNAAKENNVKRVIFASSCSVYGNSKKYPEKEEYFCNPVNPYGISKLAAEHYCKNYSDLYNLDTVILRYFTVYGPNQNSKSCGVVNLFIQNAINNKVPLIDGRGKQGRDFVFIDDIVKANYKALLLKKMSKGEIFNVGTGKCTSIIVLWSRICKILGKDITPKYVDKDLVESFKIQADVKKAEKVLGFKARVSLKQGIKKVINQHQHF